MFIVHHVITVNKWNEVCVPPPRIIQRCPNRGDVGSHSCAQERCKELNGYVKCPNFPYCMDKWYIDKYWPKDNDLKKFISHKLIKHFWITNYYYFAGSMS